MFKFWFVVSVKSTKALGQLLSDVLFSIGYLEESEYPLDLMSRVSQKVFIFDN